METTPLRRITAWRAGPATVVTIGVLLSMTVTASGQTGAPLVGVWGVIATPRNCQTNAAVAPPVRSLVTFHHDGTFFESVGLLLFAPGQRSIGHGSWTQTSAVTYTDRSVVLVAFETPPNTPPGSPGFPAGWTVTSSTITMSGADRFDSIARTHFFDTNRVEYRPPVCATRVAERFR